MRQKGRHRGPGKAERPLGRVSLVKFAGNRTILSRVSRLPLADQHRIALGGKISVITIDEEGNQAVLDVPANMLTATQARLVFDEGRILPPDEQQMVLALKKPRKRAATAGKIRVDPVTEKIKIGRMIFSRGEILSAIARLDTDSPSDDDRNEEIVNVVFRVPKPHHIRMKVAAAEANISLHDLICNSLKITGIL